MNQLYQRFFFCLFAFFLLSSSSAAQGKELLIVATDYPPYEFAVPQNGERGFDVEVVEEAFKRAGISVRFEFYPWSRALQMVEDGTAAGALTCAKNPEREKIYFFSDPISRMTDVFVVRKDHKFPPLSNMNDIKKYGLYPGTMRGNYTEKRYKQLGIPYDLSPSEVIALRKLADNRIDVIATIEENTLYNAKQLGIQDKIKTYKSEDVETSLFHVIFSKKWAGMKRIVHIFNENLSAMRQDGTYEKIHQKYK
ncbi:substrate-binding periplasmic protein [Desulfovibrio inopinatus]|uniref:substrate-binding periplasmic protein n=1 Tax=Desulfovibrio inopinatus TaxID=102109 RepID=UPI0004281499|nr:transporter substrate-binding domain-containing protein [Desulfovibrio inopinatus]